MSIINDALKKTQAELSAKEPLPAPPEEKTPMVLAVADPVVPPAPAAAVIATLPPASIPAAAAAEPPPAPKPDRNPAAPSQSVAREKKTAVPLTADEIREKKFITVTILIFAMILAAMIYMFNSIASHGLPVKTSAASAAGQSPFTINGVMVQNGKTVALINNEIYEPGEMVGNLKIVNITLDRIDVLDGDQIKSFPVKQKK